jgi:hypothetical protein
MVEVGLGTPGLMVPLFPSHQKPQKYWKLGIGVPSAEIPWISASRWQLLARFFSQPPVESGNEQLRFLSILLFFALNILNE